MRELFNAVMDGCPRIAMRIDASGCSGGACFEHIVCGIGCSCIQQKKSEAYQAENAPYLGGEQGTSEWLGDVHTC
ncbi:hypothetical protein P4E94_15675 [Pontiellaceae bacterium B12219]|nr:hypothetical protein [Pontiellaceae bacterium B12219]